MKTVNLSGKAFVLIFLAMVTACSPEAPGAGKKSDLDKKREPIVRVGSGENNSGRFGVEIYPAEPTSGDDLSVLIKGRIEKPVFLWVINGEILDDQDGPRLSSGNFARGDIVAVKVTGEDREVAAEITIANSPPRISAVLFEDPYIHRGVDIQLIPQAEDPDGDSLDFHFKWSLNGENISWDDNLLPGDKFRKGDRISVEVTPFDGHDHGEVFRGQDIIIPNAPPQFRTSPPVNFRGGTYLYEAKVEDPDGDDVTYSLVQSPPGMTIDEKTGQVTWGIGRNGPGSYPISISAQDEEGMKSIQEYVLNVAISQ